MTKAANAYLATQVTTTTQGELLIMLYDAAIKFLKQAKERMEAKDFAKKGILISRAIDIISELASSLNKEKGGEIAEKLSSLYLFCNVQLAKANLKMNTKMIDDVINILSNIRSAYAEILPEVEGKGSDASKATQSPKPAPDPQTQILPEQAAKPAAQPPADSAVESPKKTPVNLARQRAASAYGNSV